MAPTKKKPEQTLDELEARAKRRGDKSALKLIAEIRKADKKHKNPLHTGPELPKVGDDIYLPGAWYIDHGEDDKAGGLAEVVKVEKEMVGVKEFPGSSYNWGYLRDNQEKWKKEYGNNRAHPDPDYG